MPTKRKESERSTEMMGRNNDNGALAALNTAKADLASFSRVSHRLAMVDTSEKLAQVLEKLLPRVLKRIGDNHKQQQHLITKNDATLSAVLNQIHDKLVEMLSHTMKRVRDDAACRIPCSSIVQLLLLAPAENSFPVSNLAAVDSLTLNLALTFLTMGLPRCSVGECQEMLPPLLVMTSDSRRLQFHSASATQQHYQLVHMLINTIELLVDDTTTKHAPSLKPNVTTADAKEASTMNESTTTKNINIRLCPLDIARELCLSDPMVAAVTYDVLLDVILYQPVTGSIPPAGLSQSGSDRLKSSAKWSNERHRMIQLKSAVLDLIAPHKRWGLFVHSPPPPESYNESPSTQATAATYNHNTQMNLARTVALLIAATGDPVQEIAERSNAFQKQHLDSFRGTDSRATMILGDPMALAVELMTLCLGQAHAESALQSMERLGCTVEDASCSQQQQLSTKRRPVDESTVGAALLSFVSSKILNEYPNLFETSSATAVLGSLVVHVASKSLASVTGSLSKLRAKPYIAAADLLNSLAMRLSVHYDNNSSNDTGQEKALVKLLARCVSTACSVLAPIASAVSSGSTSRSTAVSNDGSIAVRDACYGVIATLSRSQFTVLPEGYLFARGAQNESSDTNNRFSINVETTTMLFGCVANEEERLRPRAVAALDALLAAYCRTYSRTTSESETLFVDHVRSPDNAATVITKSSNPWLTATEQTHTTTSVTSDTAQAPAVANRANLARSLLPLVWTSAQSYQPKASRVAASRWASDLLKELDMSSACHILCFLAGDSDVTAASIARDGLGLPKPTTNDTGEIWATTTSTGYLPALGDFASRLFSNSTSDRLQRYWDFSMQGKAATLRCGLYCLLNDLYGAEDNAVELYLSAITETLREITCDAGVRAVDKGTSSQGRASVDLLDECSACLLATLSASKYARVQLIRREGASSFHVGDIEDLALKANSSRSRRYFAGACGKLLEDKDLWSGDEKDMVDDFAIWVARSRLAISVVACTRTLTDIAMKQSGLSRLHGSSFLGAHIVRAFRLRAANAPTALDSSTANEWWGQIALVLESLGKGCLHDEEIVSNACADSLAIALSYDDADAPVLDVHLYQSTASVLSNLAKALKLFGHGETVNPSRASNIAHSAGICLAATTTGSGIIAGKDDINHDYDVGISRVECAQALFDILGSMAFRKEEEISIVVGEALAEFADAYSPVNVVWSYPESRVWPSEFSESFANQLPPHEQALYVLIRKFFTASSPHKRTASAPALLAIVARGAYRVNSDAFAFHRSLVQSLLSHLEELQKAFLSLLSDPKGKQFSRESCCLGLAACRGLVKVGSSAEQSSAPSADELNNRLLRAFGQTTNFGGSALMESQVQAAARRVNEGARSNGENTDAVESEVGGASGIGEAALGAYREMASASVALGRHDIMYALLFLSVSHAYWSTADGKHRYSASTLLGESSFVGSKTSTFEFRNALRPHLGKLLPKILRACHDPNKQTREQMSALWTGLTGGGAEGRLAISQHLLTTVDILVEEASSRLWRARVGACGALSEIIIGREWSDLGGGGPILGDDDLYGATNVSAGIRLLRLWIVATRSLDDVQGAVRDSGENLARAVRALTIHLCDPSTDQEPKGAKRGSDELARHEREATSAAATSLRWLIRHGLNQTCHEATGVCVSTLVEVVGVVRPSILELSLPGLLNSLLMAMSALEPAALNYLQLRTNDQEGLERVRLQLAQTGPLAVALTKCLELVPFVKLATQQRVAIELDCALRQSAGFATRAATADAVSTLCSTCPAVFRFSGSLSTNPSVRLLRAFYFASEREHGAGAKDKMIHALGNLAALCPASSVRSLALKACERYQASTGNNFDYASRRAAAAALRTIAVRASNHCGGGGSADIWCSKVLPVAFLGRKDSDPKIASLWNEVWEEGGSAANLADASASVHGFGIRLEEKLLPSLVHECISSLRDVSWSRRTAGSSALLDLCNLGILAPVPRSVQSLATSEALTISRARIRAEASNLALQECLHLLKKPRLWIGKPEVLKAATQVASKWAAGEASYENETSEQELYGWSEHGTRCQWRPLTISPGDFVDDLCAGDNWFIKAKVEENSSGEEPGGTVLNNDDNDVQNDENGDQAQIDFEQCDEILEEAEEAKEMDASLMDETPHSAVTFTGLCRFLIDQAVPPPRYQTGTALDELLMYRTTAFRCFRDVINSLPSECVKQRIDIYTHVSPILLERIGPRSFQNDVDKREPPVLTAGAINCVEACLWEGIGSSDYNVDSSDPNELTSILKEVGGKMQPAWTVREAAAQCMAQLALKCNAESIRRNVVVTQMVDSARQALSDTKFWRVRLAGLTILSRLTGRAGTAHNTPYEMQLNLEALLPHKESILKLVRTSLSDSEAKVTALSSNIITSITWWP